MVHGPDCQEPARRLHHEPARGRPLVQGGHLARALQPLRAQLVRRLVRPGAVPGRARAHALGGSGPRELGRARHAARGVPRPQPAPLAPRNRRQLDGLYSLLAAAVQQQAPQATGQGHVPHAAALSRLCRAVRQALQREARGPRGAAAPSQRRSGEAARHGRQGPRSAC